MRKMFPRVFGNESLLRRIGNDVVLSTFSHSYIIEGPRGSGKMLFSIQLAAALSCEKRLDDSLPLPCGECPMCQKILSSGCPDVTVISRAGRATIPIDSIRSMRRDAYLMSSEADKKVYIIDDAEYMTTAAQNSLLKVLEEPPSDVVILLLCESTSLLLDTVKSRAQTIRMSRFSCDELEKYLTLSEPRAAHMKASDPKGLATLLVSSDGCIGQALELLDKKSLTSLTRHRSTAEDFISMISSRPTYSEIYRTVSSLSQKRAELFEQLSLLSLALRDLILIRRDDEVSLCFFTDSTSALDTAERLSMKALMAIYDSLASAATSVYLNGNIPTILAGLASDIKRNKT